MSADADGGVTEAAPAKINLYLHVTGRRPDGYHLLDSLVVFARDGDSLHAAPADRVSLTIDGKFASGLTVGAENLVLRAAAALAPQARGRGVALSLTKNLPVASGIGGGSSDAAATLRALRRLWNLDESFLRAVAPSLGADVPVCLFSSPAFIGGAGEEVVAASALPAAGMVLVNPGAALATASVFAARSGEFTTIRRPATVLRDVAGLVAMLGACRNDLEPAAIGLVPEIAEVLTALAASPGCRLARMSGSGATCFGLYDDDLIAGAAAGWLAARQKPGWWIKPTALAV